MIRFYWLNIIIDFFFNFIMMDYSPTQSTLQFKFRILSSSFFVHDFPSRFYIIHTYSIIRFLSLRLSTTHDFASTVIHFAFINFSTFSSSSNFVKNISDFENDHILEKIHNFGAKDFSLSESRAKENFDENDSNWLSSQNIVELLSSESISKEISHVVEFTFDNDASFLESQFHTIEEHFQVALNYMKRSIDNDCFCCQLLQFIDSEFRWLII